ncbi:hypothetical protein HHK36_005409 [Tetracentron sinense]|uniref:Bromo domain-containing protein n=1 Tax=Tetracentron sinense TaxID=13715 RepID=A0A834ZKN1_TETSI|nr:hypothetical protein HHK36_005409 [Tetracentron sinense]
MGGGRGGASVRKQRGKRKRKDCSKEGSVGENDVWSSAVAVDSLNGRLGVVDDETFDLMGILNTVLEIENSSVFRSRLDSQKRTRYKKTIRRHMDFDTIRSRIIDRSITSGRELYRDLLLLATNAMVFYPKHSREYQSAISLKDFATRTFCQYRKDYSRDNAAADLVAEPRTRNPPVKPRSLRPCNRKVTGKVAGVGKAIAVNPSQEDEKACDADSPVESPALTKRSVGRPGKGGRGSGRKRPETPAKGRKRVRRW